MDMFNRKHNNHSQNYTPSNTEGYQDLTKEEIDHTFRLSNIQTSYQCAACGMPPQYKLIALKPEYKTADLDRNGYMCGSCAQSLPKGIYGLERM